MLFHQGQEDTGDNLVGVGAVKRDIHPGMTALQAFDRKRITHEAFRRSNRTITEIRLGIQAAGATHTEFAFVLGIEVDENIAFEHARLQTVGAGHAGLFVTGNQDLHGPMLHTLVFQDGQGQGHADAVVGTKGGPVGRKPVPFHEGGDGIRQEVVFAVARLLRDHIHVALQDHAAAFLHSGGSGGTHDHVTGSILLCLDAVVFAPLKQVLNHFLLMLRGSRNTGQAIKVIPNDLGL